MKKILLLFAVLLSTLRASAYDFEVDGIYYKILSEEDMTCEVTKGDPKYTGDVVIPASVTYRDRTFSVTTIGERAFQSCSSLTSVVIPNSVTTIGEYAFYKCSSLTSVEIPNSVTTIGGWAFQSCTGLTSVEIPNSVTEIGYGAFAYCYSLESVEIPNSVTEIGGHAFYWCTHLTSVVIGNSVTKIGASAFAYCYSLTSVEIPNSVTEIGGWAFGECSSLKSFTGKYASNDHRCLIVNGVLTSFAPAGLTTYSIPNSVTEIGDWAFRYCSSLTSVEIPNSVTRIGDCAFQGCSSLTSVEIPNSVTEIGMEAFSGCSGLTSFTGKYASNDHRCLIVNGVLTFFAPAGLTTYSIPNSVTEIGWGAFSRCSSLESVEIPNSVTTIGYCAFQGCTSLTSVEIPNSVTTIGDYAFEKCSSLTSVEIPNSVTEIGYGAFEKCSSLTEIISLNTTPPTAYYSSFDGVSKSDCVVKVPAESVDAYKAAEYWKEFEYIVALTDEELGLLVGVESVLAEGEKDARAYTLDGREARTGQRGLVIERGKKILRK